MTTKRRDGTAKNGKTVSSGLSETLKMYLLAVGFPHKSCPRITLPKLWHIFGACFHWIMITYSFQAHKLCVNTDPSSELVLKW